MERCCVACKHFRDAHYSKTYISPECRQRGQDSAAFMRQYVCGLAGALFEPKEVTQSTKEAAISR